MLKKFFKIDELSDHIKDYIDTRLSLLKLAMAEKISKVVSQLIARLSYSLYSSFSLFSLALLWRMV